MPEFNFKSPIVTRKVRETELILEEVIPSPFFIEKELEANNIIRRTTKQSVYVVNHEMIFKGSYSDFIKVYLDIYIKKLVLCLILMAELFLINL